jgi:membrane protease subunit HflK
MNQNSEKHSVPPATEPAKFAAVAEKDALDVAGRSLAEALRISFAVLKVIMAVLVAIFLASGFFSVGPDEQALVLRFGKIRGIAEQRVLGPGLHWVFPYPVDEVVKIPVAKVQVLPMDDFWYFQTEQEKLQAQDSSSTAPPPWSTLDLLRGDGYCLTRNDSIAALPGSDYNIVHCKWQLSYRIHDPELFFTNVCIDTPRPGQSFADVIPVSIAPLLKSIAANAVVTTLLNYSIDEAILAKAEIAESVKDLLQQKLDEMQSGITVVSMALTRITWPRQVDDAFQQSIQAGQKSQEAITEAQGYAVSILSEAGGPFVHQFLQLIKAPLQDQASQEALWTQLAGTAQEKIAQARAYKTSTVESAKANARYFQELLPQYRKYPELVTQRLYLDAVDFVLDSAQEKIILESAPGKQPRQIWVRFNRDPGLRLKQP